MAELYFYAKGGQRQGPFTLDQLAGQEIMPTTLVWRRGLTAWVRAGELEELSALFAPAAAEAAAAVEVAADANPAEVMGGDVTAEGAFEAEAVRETEEEIDEFVNETEGRDAEETTGAQEDEFEEDEPKEDEPKEEESEDEDSDLEFDPEYADAPDSEQQAATDDEFFNEPKPERRKLYLICGAVVAAVIAGALIFKTCSGGHEETAIVEEYFAETADSVCDDVTPTPPVAEPTPVEPAAESPATPPAEPEKTVDAAATSDTHEKLPSEEEKPSRGTKMRLHGYVNGQYEVSGSITIDGENLTGRYAYRSTISKYGDKPSSYIRLKGKIKPDGYFRAYGTNSASSRVENWQGRISGGTITAVTTGSDGSLMELDGTLE